MWIGFDNLSWTSLLFLLASVFFLRVIAYTTLLYEHFSNLFEYSLQAEHPVSIP